MSHIRLCVACSLVNEEWAFKGMILILFSHGLCSAGLFSRAYSMYCRTNTRRMLLNGGFQKVAPIFTKVLFFLVMANMATPPTLNFIGEVLGYVALLGVRVSMVIPMLVLLMIGVVVSVLMFICRQSGVLASIRNMGG